MISIDKHEHSDGIESFSIRLEKPLIKKLKKMEDDWHKQLLEAMPILKNAAYTISPYTCDVIKESIYPEARAKFEEKTGVAVEEIDKKVIAVLYKPVVWDTYYFISRNAKLVSPFLGGVYKKKGHVNLRWICTGSAVAERTLITTLINNGISDVRGVSTDISATSILLAAINLELMNVVLEKDIDVRVVFRKIPAELKNKKNTIVLQIDDALSSLKEESQIKGTKYHYDAFLADNALPYFSRDEGFKILQEAVRITNKPAVFQAFGINIGKLVEFPILVKVKEILNKNIISDTKIILDKLENQDGIKFPNGYRHKFFYNSNGVIVRMITEGAAEMFFWIGTLLRTFRIKEFFVFLRMITLATGLSKWSQISVTNTVDTYHDLLEIVQNLKVKVLDSPGEEIQWKDMIQSSFTVKIG